MKKLLYILLILSLSLSFISITACNDDEDDNIIYADSVEDAVYTVEDAVVEVAYAFYRQASQQNFDQTMSRRNINVAPEDATCDRMIFLDSASFVNSVYYEAFGINVIPYENTDGLPLSISYIYYAIQNPYNVDVMGVWESKNYNTQFERADLLNSIRAQLKPGDVISYETSSETHCLIYVGGDTIFHAVGNDFYQASSSEQCHEGKYDKEINGAVQTVNANDMFGNVSSNSYLLSSKVVRFSILRPIARGVQATENTQSRMLVKGLDGEKTSNKGCNTALSIGEEITYTVTVKNHRDLAYANVEIKDVLDSNLSFVSGSQGVSCDGQTVKFKKQIKAGETETFSWTAKINMNANVGSVIVSDKTTVGGVKQATIKNTISGYSVSQLTAVSNKAKEYANQNKTFKNEIDMVESLYKDALDITLFDYENISDVLDDMIDVKNASLTQHDLSKIVVPNLYGGQKLRNLYYENNETVRLITTKNLSIGDVIIAESDSEVDGELLPNRVVYIYVGGNQLVSCTSNNEGKVKLVTISNSQYDSANILVTIFAYNRYAVIRPSLYLQTIVNDPIRYGEGKGVSNYIKNVSDLSDILSKIPSFEEYSENANISDAEGREEFSGITVVETGYVSTYDGYRRGIRLPNQDEEDETLYKSRNQTLKNHRLEMSFAPNAVYYHSIGTMWNAVEYYVYEEPQDSSSSYDFTFYNEDFALATRTKTDFDIEIYHSKDRTMFKINSYTTVTQRAVRFEGNNLVYIDYVEESDEDLAAEGQMMANLANEMIKIREKNYGVWIEYPRAEEGESTEPEDLFAGLDPDNMTEEQEKEFFINMLVQEFSVALTEVAYQDLITVQQAHASNKAYLGRLAGYIADKVSEGNYFNRKGNSYYLKGPKYVEAVYGSEGELLEDGYTDYTVPDSYMSGVAGISAYHGNGSGANTNFDFNVGSDMVSLNQKVNTWTKFNQNEYNSNTTIMYVDNTFVKLSNLSTIKSLEEAYIQPFEEKIKELVADMYN